MKSDNTVVFQIIFICAVNFLFLYRYLILSAWGPRKSVQVNNPEGHLEGPQEEKAKCENDIKRA